MDINIPNQTYSQLIEIRQLLSTLKSKQASIREKVDELHTAATTATASTKEENKNSHILTNDELELQQVADQLRQSIFVSLHAIWPSHTGRHCNSEKNR